MIVDFEGDVFRWDARTEAWFFVELPEHLGSDIREIPRPRRGFGAVRVAATIGTTRWRTSIFPAGGSGAYVLPLKKSVRDAEGIADGARLVVRVEVLDM